MEENSTEFGELIAQSIASVVRAQERLDQYALERRKAYESAQPGELVLPPLWYQFKQVELDLELSARVEKTAIPGKAGLAPYIKCTTLNPTTVSVYGYQAASGMRVRIQVEPKGNMWIKPEDDGTVSNGGTT